MALVMLPCDLPWWTSIHRKLTTIKESTNLNEILETMHKIHDLCNISLDPDEDKRDSTILDGLRDFLFDEMEDAEREHFQTYTIKNLAKRAQDLKLYRPPRGLNFSLQQQPDTTELNYNLLGALLANAFFSTFPKRTEKTHPTLQDFNFTNFFRSLDTNSQKAKFRSFLYYFDWLESINCNIQNSDDKIGTIGDNININNKNTNNNNDINNNTINDIDDYDDDNKKQTKNHNIKISRKVMPGKQWLTIEDWLECTVLLCPLEIRHEGKIERTRPDIVQSVFSSSRIGGNVLWNGNSQECVHFGIFPEILVTLLYCEALEDNEALFIENATQLTRIIDPKNRSVLEPLEEPRKISLCLMDAEDYSEFPITQFEEDNILRELNKCLLAFRQNTTCSVLIENRDRKLRDSNNAHQNKSRLSPIGESGTNSPGNDLQQNNITTTTTIIIKQASTLTNKSSYDSENIDNDISRRRSWLSIDPGGGGGGREGSIGSPERSINNGSVPGPTASGRRGRFIVLGSSGECLPVNRISMTNGNSACESVDTYSSCDSGSEDYLSANESLDEQDDSDEDFAYKYSKELDTPAKRYSFAEKLREALRQSENYTESTDDSYAVDISISGSKTGDEGIRIPRGGSTGFVLQEDSVDEEFYNNSLSHEKEWLEKFRNKLQTVSQQKRDSNNSSKYSFSSEYSSDLEELYEQFSKWLEDPILKDKVKELDPRDEAVLRFASSLLKRTLSESFVGVPLTDGCISSTSIGAEENSINNYNMRKNRPILSSRSLSLELTKHKHRLAAHLKRLNKKLSRKSSPKHPKWSITRVQTHQSIDCDDVILKISQIGKTRIGKGGVSAVATGNWGCGESLKGDVQLKLAIQWMSASVAGLPILVYYTSGHERLSKLDTVCRLLLDRKWTVSELAAAALEHSKDMINDPNSFVKNTQCFFDKLIGI